MARILEQAKLTKTDINRRVLHLPTGAKGRLIRYNEFYAFVSYDVQRQSGIVDPTTGKRPMLTFDGPDAAASATSFEELAWE